MPGPTAIQDAQALPPAATLPLSELFPNVSTTPPVPIRIPSPVLLSIWFWPSSTPDAPPPALPAWTPLPPFSEIRLFHTLIVAAPAVASEKTPSPVLFERLQLVATRRVVCLACMPLPLP